MTAKELLAAVKIFNAALPTRMRISHLKDKTVMELDGILDTAEHLRSVATVSALCDSAKSRVTQTVHRDVCIRILALLATDAPLLELYKASLGSTDQKQLDAGNKTSSNPGLGCGLNHEYHHALVQKFNDVSITPDFPYEPQPQPCQRCMHRAATDTKNSSPSILDLRNGTFLIQNRGGRKRRHLRGWCQSRPL